MQLDGHSLQEQGQGSSLFRAAGESNEPGTHSLPQLCLFYAILTHREKYPQPRCWVHTGSPSFPTHTSPPLVFLPYIGSQTMAPGLTRTLALPSSSIHILLAAFLHLKSLHNEHVYCLALFRRCVLTSVLAEVSMAFPSVRNFQRFFLILFSKNN